MDSENFFRNKYSSHFDKNNDRLCYAVDCYDSMESFAELKAIEFTEWLIKKCDFQKHGVWLYRGMEFTQRELFNIFKNDSKP